MLIELGAGRFEPRAVRLGARSDLRVEIVEGVREGESVVVAANFLIDAESNLKAAIGGFGHSAHGATPKEGAEAERVVPAATGVSHRASGRIDDYDPKNGTASIEHGPIESLKWPGMTMEFKIANEALVKGLKPGARIDFEFVERGEGEWVITSVKPIAMGQGAGTPAPAANAHSGH